MHKNEEFLKALKAMNSTVKADNADGHQWKYCNVKSRKGKDFADARKKGKYLINCVDGVVWALMCVGIKSVSWYGGDGKIVWLNDHAKVDAKKNFDIISTGGKTVAWLEKNARLCDGDILLGYQGMNHTNVYYGNGKSFDSGHAYASGSGEGAKIKKLIGSLAHKNSKVNYILRLKDRAHYRVQCGAYSDIGKFNEQVEIVEKKGFSTTKVVEEGLMKVQVGYFSGKTNAERLAEKVAKKKLDVFVKEIE
jgi:hypothetical protein